MDGERAEPEPEPENSGGELDAPAKSSVKSVARDTQADLRFLNNLMDMKEPKVELQPKVHVPFALPGRFCILVLGTS